MKPDILSLVGLAIMLLVNGCAQAPKANPVAVAEVFISERNAGHFDAASELFADGAVVGAANLQQYTGRTAIREWLRSSLRGYYLETAQQPQANGDRASWVENIFSDEGPWVGEIGMEIVVQGSKITSLDATLRRGATGVICPLCPPMCPGSDTPNLPCTS